MINYGANYIGVDRDRYDAGNKFYSQDRFLQGVGLDKPAMTFNSSPNNLGIMGMYPKYPYPPIMSEDGGDGGGPIGPKGNSKFDYEFDALGGLYNKDNVALTDEERDTLNAQKNKDRLAMAGKLGLFALNPMGYLMGKGINKAFGFAKDKFFGGNDGDGGGDGPGPDINPGTFTAESLSSSFDSEEGPAGGSQESSSPGSTGPGGSDEMGSFEYGGRVGYSGGGLSKYEIFKLGELGYNTKGGTVLAPFGGIKVLRDILKVNNYAGGGIVGLYR